MRTLTASRSFVARSSSITSTSYINQQASSSLRSFHNPSRVRGVGPRPDQKLRAVRTAQVARQRAELTRSLLGVAPIRSPVSVQLYTPQTLAPSNKPIVVESFVPAAATFDLDIHSLQRGVVVGTETLPREVFGVDVRTDILHRVVEWQRAGQRQGTAKTKGRAEVSGTGKKPHPQKGTGAARQGTKRGPHHYKGGVAHGKIPRDFSYDLPKKIRAMGVRVALTVKHLQGNVKIVDHTVLGSHKTKYLSASLQVLNLPSSFLLVHADGELDPNMALAARNMPNCHFLPVMGCNVLSLMKHQHVLFTRKALTDIRERLDRTSTRNRSVQFMIGSDGKGINASEFLALQQRAQSQQTTETSDDTPVSATASS